MPVKLYDQVLRSQYVTGMAAKESLYLFDILATFPSNALHDISVTAILRLIEHCCDPVPWFTRGVAPP
jgi:hypothetical protein